MVIIVEKKVNLLINVFIWKLLFNDFSGSGNNDCIDRVFILMIVVIVVRIWKLVVLLVKNNKLLIRFIGKNYKINIFVIWI